MKTAVYFAGVATLAVVAIALPQLTAPKAALYCQDKQDHGRCGTEHSGSSSNKASRSRSASSSGESSSGTSGNTSGGTSGGTSGSG